jgi:hypothetical protein
MAQIEVDFNSRDENGYVPALVSSADGPLQPGAMVVAVEHGVVALDPIWRTFTKPHASRLRLQPIPGRRFEWTGPLSVTLVPRVSHGPRNTRDMERSHSTTGAAQPEPA